MKKYLLFPLILGVFFTFSAPVFAEDESADATSCTNPNEETDPSIEKINRLACDSIGKLPGPEYCPTCPKLPSLQAFSKSCEAPKKSTDRKKLTNAWLKCFEGLHHYACKVSPWKKLTLQERYSKMMKLMDNPESHFKTPFPKSVFPCLAMRETLYLDPVTIDCGDLSGSDTQTGLGHVNRATFLDLFGAKSKTKTSASTLKRLQEADWLKPYSCPPPPPDPETLFENAYERDPLVQLQTMEQVLREKTAPRGKSDAQIRAAIGIAVEKYNGSKTKVEYRKAVMACVSCFGKKGANPLTCLGFASSQKIKNGNICTNPPDAPPL